MDVPDHAVLEAELVAVGRVAEVLEDAEHADNAHRLVDHVTSRRVGRLVVVRRDSWLARVVRSPVARVHGSFETRTRCAPAIVVVGGISQL